MELLIWDIYDRIFWELNDIITQNAMIFVSKKFYVQYANKIKHLIYLMIRDSRNPPMFNSTLFFYRTFVQQNIIVNQNLYFFNEKRILQCFDSKNEILTKPFGEKKGSFFCVYESDLYLAQHDTIFSIKGDILILPSPIRNMQFCSFVKKDVLYRIIICNTTDNKYYKLENTKDGLVYIKIKENDIGAKNYRQKELKGWNSKDQYLDHLVCPSFRTRTIKQKICWSGIMAFYLSPDGTLAIDKNSVGSFTKKIENVIDFIVEEISVGGIGVKVAVFYITINPINPGVYNMYRYNIQNENSSPIYSWNFHS